MLNAACVAVVLSLIIAATRPSPDATVAREAQKLLERVATPDGPGIVLLVAKRNDVLFRGARGLANVELGVPLSPDHVFRIASVTKIFTAATVLKLAETGKIAIDDRLANYLPDFPNAATITIRQLLNHTAGISDVVKDPQPGFSRRDISTDIRIGELARRPLDFRPGSSWAYSNSGYILLGAVIERATGKPWIVTLQEQLLDPIGLKNTRFGADAPVIAGRVAGYTRDLQTRAVGNAGFMSMTVPDSAGALVSTADDLLAWMRALMSGRVISRGSLQQMITPSTAGPTSPANYRYGFGVYLWRVRDRLMIGHTGQINGFAASVGYLPEEDITTIVLCNDDTFDARTVGRRLAAAALGQPYPEVASVLPSPQQLRDLEGTYRFDGNTLLRLTVSDLTVYWQRGDRRPLALQMTASGQLHFVPDELTYVAPVRDDGGTIIRLDYFPDGEGPPRALPRMRR